jgi:hypothetical protein
MQTMSRLVDRTMVSLKTVGVAAAAVLLVVATSACSDNTLSQLAAASNPAPNPQTEVFTGTLSQNGAFQHIFTTTTLGAVTVSITSLAPNTTQIVGLSLGVWTGQCSTSPQTGGASNDTAVVGSSITLNATAAGNLCARLYDVGFVTQPVLYTITITHP